MRLAGLGEARIDLGHTGVVRGILDVARPPAPLEDDLLAALSAKDMPLLSELVGALPSEVGDALLALGRLNGGREVLARASGELPRVEAIAAALRELEQLVDRCPADAVSIDLADLHGYRYLTGVTFAVHAAGLPSAVLRGGRYDDIGRAFGRARPAVGFSIYLRELARLFPDDAPRAILAPAGEDRELLGLIERLRASGEIVVRRLAGEPAGHASGDFNFDREIARVAAGWQVVPRTGLQQGK
jgi:ATP phosphoribosyltransferase regulatory subunit